MSARFGVSVCLSVLAVSVAAFATESESSHFKQAKTGLQTQLRSRTSETRIAAIQELSGFSELPAAKLILQSASKDADPEVRKAARLALHEFKENPQVCEHFAALIGKDTRKKLAAEGTLALAEVLLCTEDPALHEPSLAYLDRAVAPSRDGPLMLFALVEELKELHGLPPLMRIAKSDVFKKCFPLRRVLVQTLVEIREPATVESLIELLPIVRGEVRADVIKYLVGLTGQKLGADAPAWNEWWIKNKDTFEYPAEIGQVAIDDTIDSQARYYGLPLYGERLVFIVDVSGSMEGGKLDAAKRELINTLFGLPDETHFSIITFSSGANVWDRNLVPATLANKKKAQAYVLAQRPGGTTASYTALQAGLQFDAEAIYFLSDGEPTAGRIVVPQAILEAIGRENKLRRMSVYAIGIGTGGRGSPFDNFMESLAKENAGAFRAIE